MQRAQLKIGLAVIVLAAAVLACSFGFSTAKVENARLASDEAGNSPTTTFGQEDTFYLLGDLENAPDDTKLKATWTAVEVQDNEPNTLIDEVELTGGSGPFTFTLENQAPLWPPGKYKVDLYLDDELNQTLEFQVEQTVQAELLNLRMALDPDGLQSTTSFPPTENFYLAGELSNAPTGANIKAIWSAIELLAGTASGTTEAVSEGVITEQAEQFSQGPFSFSLEKGSELWPAGRYSVDVYLNDDLVQTLEFQVEGAAAVSAERVFTALDENGNSPTSVFSPQDPFYLIAEIVNAPSAGVPVKVVWTTVSVEGDAADNQEINTYEGTAENGLFWSSLTSNEGIWPVGTYQADFYLDGNLFQSVTFDVAEGGAGPSPVDGAAVEGVYLALDDEGEKDSNVFSPGDTFYLIGELVNAPQGAKIEAIWMAEAVEGYAADEVISEPTSFDTQEGPFSISLKKDDGGAWTQGQYKVDLQLNGETVETRYFLVTDVKLIDPYMATDETGNTRTQAYGTQQTFFLHFTLGNAPPETKVTTKWYKLADGAGEDELYNEEDYNFGTGDYYVKLSHNEGVWPPGAYVVDIYLNDYFSASVYFDVQ